MEESRAEHTGAESPDPRALIEEAMAAAERMSCRWDAGLLWELANQVKSDQTRLAEIRARAEKAERELAAVIEKWPTEDTAGIAAPGILGEHEEGWTCNAGGFPTPEAAVRAYCGLDPAPAGGGGEP